MSRDVSPDYPRALALLAGRDRRTDAFAYVARAAQRAAGAQVAVLLVASPAGATPTPVRALGRAAKRVAAELGSAAFGTRVRVADAAGYRLLIVPLTTPTGVAGALAAGVRRPRRFSAFQRRHIRALADAASVALQLATPRQPTQDAPPAPSSGYRTLSRREREVVTLLLAGASAKEAAARLGLSQRTVETYLQRLKVRERQPRLHALLAQLVRQGRA